MLKPRLVTALGLMSGTSLDGVDAAILRTDGEVIAEFGPVAYRPYTAAERANLRAALGCWPDDPPVAVAAEIVETAHAQIITRFSGVEIVGFHGQTLAHDPGGRGTHQAGSGQILALVTELPVVWDFRSADIGLGGQGAPLAPFFHFALARHLGMTAPVAFLNLGGVGNLTVVDPSLPQPETEGALLAFDTGPANAPIDDLCRLRRGVALDEGGQLAASGRVDDGIVADFLKHPYFFREPPKSLDREFPGLARRVADLSDADAAATLSDCAARAVAAGFDLLPRRPERLLVAGGGRHNADMMARIRRYVGCKVDPVDAVGLNGDMLEAQAFAYLAVRVARGLPTSCPSTTGVAAAVGGGQISRP